jgi:hypothetical protein
MFVHCFYTAGHNHYLTSHNGTLQKFGTSHHTMAHYKILKRILTKQGITTASALQNQSNIDAH